MMRNILTGVLTHKYDWLPPGFGSTGGRGLAPACQYGWCASMATFSGSVRVSSNHMLFGIRAQHNFTELSGSQFILHQKRLMMAKSFKEASWLQYQTTTNRNGARTRLHEYIECIVPVRSVLGTDYFIAYSHEINVGRWVSAANGADEDGGRKGAPGFTDETEMIPTTTSSRSRLGAHTQDKIPASKVLYVAIAGVSAVVLLIVPIIYCFKNVIGIRHLYVDDKNEQIEPLLVEGDFRKQVVEL